MTDIDRAVHILKSGDVIGLPTETVYGLAASVDSPTGVDKIFSIKERPFFDPLIVHIHSIQQAKKYSTGWNDSCEKLAMRFWPGPLTMILTKKDNISDKITSGLATVGLRMPNHKVALELIEKLGCPVAAPSANKFKRTSPTTALHVREEFPNLFVIDGQECSIGIESTIIGFEGESAVIYRPGMIPLNELEECLNQKILIKESPVAPGHLKHHYMPKKPIITFNEKYTNEQLNMHCPNELTENMHIWNLPEDPTHAARVLYAKFRDFDQMNISAIGIKFTHHQEDNPLFIGIFNRIFKAASFILAKEITNKT